MGIYNSEIYTCDICGKPLYPNNTILTATADNEWVRIHYACYDQYIGKCATCSACQCKLDQDHTAPKYIMSPVRRGNMIIQTQILNPLLVDKYCRAGCLCWNQTSCVRQTGLGCQNYKLIMSKRQ